MKFGFRIGSTINYAVKFAYAGGLVITKYVSYVVGSNCSLGTETSSALEQFTFENPAHESVHINSRIPIDKVEIYSMLGALVLSTNENTNDIAIRNLSKGIYLLTVYSGTKKSVKKLIVE